MFDGYQWLRQHYRPDYPEDIIGITDVDLAINNHSPYVLGTIMGDVLPDGPYVQPFSAKDYLCNFHYEMKHEAINLVRWTLTKNYLCHTETFTIYSDDALHRMIEFSNSEIGKASHPMYTLPSYNSCVLKNVSKYAVMIDAKHPTLQPGHVAPFSSSEVKSPEVTQLIQKGILRLVYEKGVVEDKITKSSPLTQTETEPAETKPAPRQIIRPTISRSRQPIDLTPSKL